MGDGSKRKQRVHYRRRTSAASAWNAAAHAARWAASHSWPPSPSSPARTWPHAAQYLHTVSCCIVLTTSIYPRQLVIGIGQLAASAVELAQAKGGAAKIFKLLDKAPEIPVSGGEVPTETMRGAVSFKEVNFSYPSSPQQPVLRGLSFSVPGVPEVLEPKLAALRRWRCYAHA